MLETSRNSKNILYGMLLCTFVIALHINLRPFLIKIIINQHNFNLSSYATLGLIYVFAQFIIIGVNYIFDLLSTNYLADYRKEITHKYLDKITNYPYKFFQESSCVKITNHIRNLFNLVPITVITLINKFINLIMVIFITVIILSFIDSIFVYLILGWIFLCIALSIFFYTIYADINLEYIRSKGKIFFFLENYIINIKNIWSFNNQDYEKKEFTQKTEDCFTKSRKAGIFLCKYYAILGLMLGLYIACSVVLIGYLRSNLKITPGDYALIFMVNFKIIDILFDISNISRNFMTNWGVLKNSVNYLEKVEIIEYKANKKDLKLEEKPNIVFDKVTFGYEGSRILFDNFSLNIKKGEKVGLVGYSGSGESSLINLLLRLYEISAGSILINNHNITDFTRDSLRKHIDIISEDSTLFNRSIIENIRYGNLAATDEEIIEAAKAAKAHDFIINLHDGYNSMVVGELGYQLSSGQIQRIIIARALLKNAPILILDEATSKLDSLTENNIQKALLYLMNKATTLVISHHLSTLIHMDRIIVFDHGKIVEEGSHQELLAINNGIYKSMWNAKMEFYHP